MRRSLLSRLFALTLSLALWAAPAAQALTPEQAAELLQAFYIDEVPPSALEQPTIKEMVAALGDPYTEYFTPEEYVEFVNSMSDTSLVGIGVVYTRSGDNIITSTGLVLEQVLPDSPAARGGLMAGDAIIAVDEKSTIGEDIDVVTSWIRGEEDTPVSVTYRRGDEETTVVLTRATVTMPATTTELLDGHIGYISCTTFGEETVGHFKDGIEAYQDQADLWIVDLRSNLGGATDAATTAASLFTGTGWYMSILRDGSGSYSAYYATEEAMTLHPVIVLVDPYSASSSEIFAAAIQSTASGIVLGSRTFGKGVAQIVMDKDYLPEYFPDGDAIKITTFRFYSPIGNTTDQVGVLPDLLIDPEYTAAVASLFRSNPPADTSNALRVDLTWRWYIDLDMATSEEYIDAFQVLLNSLPLQTKLYREGEALSQWTATSVKALCQEYRLEYLPPLFEDHEDSQYPDALSILKTYGLVHGMDDGAFYPQANLTRAELCQLLAEALNCALSDGEIPEGPYSDVSPDAWYAPAVHAMTKMGLVSGYDTGVFCPSAPVSHQELLTIMGRLAKFLNIGFYDAVAAMPEEALEAEEYTAYADWARPSVWLLNESQSNLFGFPQTMLWSAPSKISPTADSTRDETIYVLYTLLTYTGILDV